MDNITSIIFIHYAMNEHRSQLAKECFNSLYESVKHLPVEMIVVDNGGSLEDSKFFVEATQDKKITHYIRNADNLWFGYARNQGLDMSTGEFICIVDNDLKFEKGWLEECLKDLRATKGKKLFTTPLAIDRAHNQAKYSRPSVTIDGVERIVNVFAGSNCWVMRREDYERIGYFVNHYIAGTKWCQKYALEDYAVITPIKPMADHIGLEYTPYVGYSKYGEVEIIKKYIDGTPQILN